LDEFLSSYDDSSKTARKKSIVRAVTAAAEKLGNTKTVCRSSYIHSGLLAAAEDGRLTAMLASIRRSKKSIRSFSRVECMLVALLNKL
jgi:DNA topoisomerase-1